MKKSFVLCIFSFVAVSLFAQEAASRGEALPPIATQEVFPDTEFRFYNEYPWALGGSYELGRNARKNAASGFGLSLDRYMFTQYVALGLRGAMLTDGNTISATEALLSFRVYAPIRNSNTTLFAQWGFGALFYTEEGRERNTYTMDFLTGCRIYINERILRGFYIEPYIRAGYPFLVSGGLAIGHWFSF
jgi:hypothetical protein